jgi:hypothetical protein
MENVFHQIIVVAILDIIHLIAHYIIVIINNIMIQQFAMEMENVFYQKIVFVIMVGHMKTVKHICAIKFRQI